MKTINMAYEEVIQLKNKIIESKIECGELLARDKQSYKMNLLNQICLQEGKLWNSLSKNTKVTEHDAQLISEWTTVEQGLEYKSKEIIKNNSNLVGGLLLKNHEDLIGYCSAQKYLYFSNPVFEFGSLCINPDRRGVGLGTKIQKGFMDEFLTDKQYYLLTKSNIVKENSFKSGLLQLDYKKLAGSELKKIMELGGKIEGYTIFANQQLLDLFTSLEPKNDII